MGVQFRSLAADWRPVINRAFGSAAVVGWFPLLTFGVPAPQGNKLDLDFHKQVPPSELKIELSPVASVTRSKQGLVLSLKVTNASANEIKTTLAHEWHGGE